MTYTYKIIQYKNKSYSGNSEHHGSVALTDAQHEIECDKNYNETLKTIGGSDVTTTIMQGLYIIYL